MKEAIPSHNYPTSDCVVRKALYCKIGDFIKKIYFSHEAVHSSFNDEITNLM